MIKWQLQGPLVIEMILESGNKANFKINFGTGIGNADSEKACRAAFNTYIKAGSRDSTDYIVPFAKVRSYHDKIWATALRLWGYPVLMA
jgi:hypothetical protein